MVFENSSEQYRPSEVRQPTTASLLPSNHEYQQFFKPTNKAGSEPAFLDFGNYNIYGDQAPIKLAQNAPFPVMPTLVPSPDQLGLSKPVIDSAAKAVGSAADLTAQQGALRAEKTWNPYRGDITAEINKVPEAAWHQAYEAFPQFKQAGLSEQQTKELMQAVIRNELYNYNAADKVDDEQATKNGKPLDLPKRPANDATLGDSQLSINAVLKRAQEYPEQLGQFKGHELEALLDPKNSPVLVAATLAHNIEMYKRHNIPVTKQSLAYSYNPPGGRILPNENDLKSEHVHNVMHQLGIIRGQVKPRPDER